MAHAPVKCLSSLIGALCIAQGGSLQGQAAGLPEAVGVRIETEAFAAFGVVPSLAAEDVRVDSLPLTPAATVYTVTWGGRGAHVAPTRVTIGRVGSHAFPLGGMPEPRLTEFAAAARLTATDSTSAVRVGALLAASMSPAPCGPPVFPDLEKPASGVASVLNAWRAARADGSLTALWRSPELGPATFARDVVSGRLFARFPMLLCDVAGLWSEHDWTVVFGRNGALVAWQVFPGQTFAVPKS